MEYDGLDSPHETLVQATLVALRSMTVCLWCSFGLHSPHGAKKDQTSTSTANEEQAFVMVLFITVNDYYM